MKNTVKFGIFMAVVSLCVILSAFAQREALIGYTSFATGGRYYPNATNGAPQAVSIAASSTNSTNFIVIPAESSVRNDDPAIAAQGAVPQVNFLQAVCQTLDTGGVSVPNLVFFWSTNAASVLAGDEGGNNQGTVVTQTTNQSYYGGIANGSGTNAFWLNGKISGIITNQFVVIKHQGVEPIPNSYEVAIVASNLTAVYTNSYTNGQGQVTTINTTNSVVTIVGQGGGNGGWSTLVYPIKANDKLYFEVTNYVMPFGTNVPSGSAGFEQFIQSSPSGIATGERAKPMLIMARGSNVVFNANVNYLK